MDRGGLGHYGMGVRRSASAVFVSEGSSAYI